MRSRPRPASGIASRSVTGNVERIRTANSTGTSKRCHLRARTRIRVFVSSLVFPASILVVMLTRSVANTVRASFVLRHTVLKREASRKNGTHENVSCHIPPNQHKSTWPIEQSMARRPGKFTMRASSLKKNQSSPYQNPHRIPK